MRNRARNFSRTIRSSIRSVRPPADRLKAFYAAHKGVIVPIALFLIVLSIAYLGRTLPVHLPGNRVVPVPAVSGARGRPERARAPAPSLTQDEILAIAAEIARRHGLDPLLIHSMIAVESGFDPLARSPKGAMGVMQLMPETATEMGVEDPYDVRQNIDGAVRYIKRLLHRYRRYPKKLELALAAYNAGPRNVRRHRGIPPYRETRKYVRKVLSRYHKLKKGSTS